MGTTFYVISAYLIVFLILHFGICTFFFVLVQRPLFVACNYRISNGSVSVVDIFRIIWHGLYTDVKVAAYMTIVPLIVSGYYAFFPSENGVIWIVVYNILIAVPVSILCIADIALYRYWQFKIDASVLHYLQSLKGTFASVTLGYIVISFCAVISMAGLLAVPLVYNALFWIPPANSLLLAWWEYILVPIGIVVIAGIFFLVIRGCHIRPDTPVYSYFSNRQFLNHSAVNPVYNFIYSLSINDDFGRQFQTFDETYCRDRITSLFPNCGVPQVQLLHTNRPNIVVIVWESLCAQFMSCLGGRSHVMPHFDQLAEEGVLFTNCWAGSFRTDRGLVCTLSGYLGMPTASAILYTNKLPHLPALPRLLRDKAGYETMAVHGGQLNIFHKSDYYWASGHDLLVEEHYFPSDAPRCRWGVHDGYVFVWLADDIITEAEKGKRWFKTFQTLSSHEPFSVPYHCINHNVVDNAYAYVDEAFGMFVEKLKASAAWRDLLIVVTGDHGLDIGCAPDKDRNTHIPLLLLGGAIRQPMKIDTLMNQTDIAATLLGQMGLPHDEFVFSRDVLADTYTYPFAFHAFNNGFIFRDATGVTAYDNVVQQAISGHDQQREETAKIILQSLYSDFDKR